MPLEQTTVVQASDGPAIDKFLRDLKEARKNSTHAGGSYSAFLLLTENPKLEVRVHVKRGD